MYPRSVVMSGSILWVLKFVLPPSFDLLNYVGSFNTSVRYLNGSDFYETLPAWPYGISTDNLRRDYAIIMAAKTTDFPNYRNYLILLFKFLFFIKNPIGFIPIFESIICGINLLDCIAKLRINYLLFNYFLKRGTNANFLKLFSFYSFWIFFSFSIAIHLYL